MEKNLVFFFDQEGDILDVSVGRARKAISEEIKDDVFVRLDPKTNKVVGFMIVNFVKRFGRTNKRETIPVTGDFKVAKELVAA